MWLLVIGVLGDGSSRSGFRSCFWCCRVVFFLFFLIVSLVGWVGVGVGCVHWFESELGVGFGSRR